MSKIPTDALDALFESKTSTIARDLKLNLKRILEDGALAPDEALLALLATSSSVGQKALAAFARDQLTTLDFTHEQIAEAEENAALMGMLNTYYRFRHMVGKDDDYKIAGLRMTAISRPQLGRERFEMLSLAVSVLNGCESCIKAHEKVLREVGVGVDKLHDLARMAAVVKGLAVLTA
jgi:lipoyl-dependent peroxiredoxin subunit D